MAIRKITASSISTGSIATVNMADESVTSLKIADGGVGSADIASGAITPAKLSTGGLYWDSSSNVGIGTSSPSQLLSVSSATTSSKAVFTNSQQSLFVGAGNGEGQIYGSGAYPLVVYTNATERLRITSSGNVGIGTSSPATPLDVTKANGGNFVATFQNTSSSTPYGVFIKDAPSSANGYPLLTVTNSAGAHYFRVDSGTGYVTMPYQPAFSAYGGGANSSGAIVFATALYNNGSHYSTSTGRFTAPVTGMYYFYTQQLANSGNFDVSFNKNGSRLLGHAESNEAEYKSVSNAQVIFMNAGDYVYVEVWTGAAYGQNYCMFTGYLIG